MIIKDGRDGSREEGVVGLTAPAYSCRIASAGASRAARIAG